jgi:enterochelin esterase-like enzyme
MLSFRVNEALGPDQLMRGCATGQLAPAVIVLPDRIQGQKRQQSILEFMVPKRTVRRCDRVL